MRSTRCSLASSRGFAACILFSFVPHTYTSLHSHYTPSHKWWGSRGGSSAQKHQLTAHRGINTHTHSQHFSVAKRTQRHKIQQKTTNKNNVKWWRRRSGATHALIAYVCCLLFRKCMYVVVVVLFMSTYYDMAAKARGLNFSSSKALKKQPLTKPSVFFLMPRLRLTTPAPSPPPPRPFRHTTHDMHLLHAQVREKGGKNGKTNTTFAYKLHCFICFAFEPNSISSSISKWNGWTENQERKGKKIVAVCVQCTGTESV